MITYYRSMYLFVMGWLY